MSFRLYAHRGGAGSWARVAAGCEAGLRTLGHLAGFHDASADEFDGGSNPDGHEAPAGLAIGEPGVWPLPHQLGAHEHKLALVAPNSTWVPPYLRSLCQQGGLTSLVAPSRWAQSLFASELDVPVHLWQHGIDAEAFYPDRAATAEMADGHPFTVLHLCSCGTPGERKGTLELLQAWANLDAAGALGEHDLLIVVAPDVVAGVPLRQRVEQLRIDAKVRLCGRINGSFGTMREVYQRAHVVCQPSRCEGFGWIPLEARASGVPVVATACTGHADHIEGVASVIVRHGFAAPIDDGPGALAPSVSPHEIAEALSYAKRNWEHLAVAALNEADGVRRRWSWERTTKDFLEGWGDQAP